jgi:hypothetical protein
MEDEMGSACSTIGEKRNACSILVEKPERDHWDDQDVGGWTLLQLILDRMGWIGLIWLRIGQVDGSCEHGNEPSGSIKRWEILASLQNWRLLKKGSAP